MSSERPSTKLAFIAPGHEILEAIAQQLPDADGWLQGAGYVDGVELRVAADNAETVTRLNGRFNLLSLTGPRGGPLTVMLSRMTDAGIQVIGGELVSSRSAGVNAVLFLAPRALVPGAHVPAPSPPAIPARPGPGGATWDIAAAASARAAREEAEHVEEPVPEAGDWVQHFAFGLCEVLTSDGDRLRIRDLDGPKRIREVALSMLRVTGPTDSDGKRLYQLARRAPGG
jgi:hypothetical protein